MPAQQPIQQEPYPPQFLPQIDSGLQPAPPNEDFFKYRIEGLDILETLQHQLRGEIKVEGKYERVFDRWVNDEGISKILHIVYSCGINKNIFLGNLTHEQINFKCRLLKIKIARLIFDKYEDYEIKKEMKSLIVETVKNQIHSALSRCEEGKEADQISTAATRQEVYHEGLDQKQPSRLNPFNLFRKKQ